jgi:hypothetical protein
VSISDVVGDQAARRSRTSASSAKTRSASAAEPFGRIGGVVLGSPRRRAGWHGLARPAPEAAARLRRDPWCTRQLGGQLPAHGRVAAAVLWIGSILRDEEKRQFQPDGRRRSARSWPPARANRATDSASAR